MGRFLVKTNQFVQARFDLLYNPTRCDWHHQRCNVQCDYSDEWFMILALVTDYEMKAFDIFLEFSTGKKTGWSLDEVKKCATRFCEFITEMNRMNITDLNARK